MPCGNWLVLTIPSSLRAETASRSQTSCLSRIHVLASMGYTDELHALRRISGAQPKRNLMTSAEFDLAHKTGRFSVSKPALTPTRVMISRDQCAACQLAADRLEWLLTT